MINKIQYLRKLTPIGQSGTLTGIYRGLSPRNNNFTAGTQQTGSGALGGNGTANLGSGTSPGAALYPTAPWLAPTTTTNAAPATVGTVGLTGAAGMTGLTGMMPTNQNTGLTGQGQGVLAPTTNTTNVIHTVPSNLIFRSITDLTTTSNHPLVHSRDLAGNIILINDTASNNQLLTIESISYTVPNATLNNVINTQFNYFKFPPRLGNIEVADEINLTDAIDEIDTISTRYTPSLSSGRQSAGGRPPTLRAGTMIAEGVDDANVAAEPWGYYNRDNNSYGILNMETILAGTGQLKPSKFIITPDLIDAGEDIFFRIRIDHNMKGNNTGITVPHPANPYAATNGTGFNKFESQLNKVSGTTGAFNTVMRAGNYPSTAYMGTVGTFTGNLQSRLAVNISNIQQSLNSFKAYSNQYANLLATTSDRTTTQQRAQLVLAKNRVTAAELSYNSAVNAFINTQTSLNNRLAQETVESPLANVLRTYEMLYIVDIQSASPYDEYWIDTRCATYNNEIGKNATYWQIVPVSKIKNAF